MSWMVYQKSGVDRTPPHSLQQQISIGFFPQPYTLCNTQPTVCRQNMTPWPLAPRKSASFIKAFAGSGRGQVNMIQLWKTRNAQKCLHYVKYLNSILNQFEMDIQGLQILYCTELMLRLQKCNILIQKTTKSGISGSENTWIPYW